MLVYVHVLPAGDEVTLAQGRLPAGLTLNPGGQPERRRCLLPWRRLGDVGIHLEVGTNYTQINYKTVDREFKYLSIMHGYERNQLAYCG